MTNLIYKHDNYIIYQDNNILIISDGHRECSIDKFAINFNRSIEKQVDNLLDEYQRISEEEFIRTMEKESDCEMEGETNHYINSLYD